MRRGWPRLYSFELDDERLVNPRSFFREALLSRANPAQTLHHPS